MIYCSQRLLRKCTITLLWLLVLSMPTTAQTVVIAALGDSLTQGYGLPRENGFVPQLEASLREQGEDVKILNAGVSGDTTAGGLSRVEWTLTPDVDALILNLGGNDLLRGIDPASSRKNLDAILAIATQRSLPVLLVGMIAPGNFGPEYKEAFDPIYRELSQKYGTLFYENFFAALIEADNALNSNYQFMQGDGIHPNTDGVGKVVHDLSPIVRQLIEQVRN